MYYEEVVSDVAVHACITSAPAFFQQKNFLCNECVKQLSSCRVRSGGGDGQHEGCRHRCQSLGDHLW